ncbi:mannonate dehydratase [Falsiroseomonas sp. HW251]|uniref:mannonate dehydratase n=1 Tax=Falsiroseomonas sp. HW251 TaxID=3390998 RepID=UPI003D319C9F
MRLCMLLPPRPDRRWTVARQMGVTAAIAKLAPDLTGRLPPWNFESLAATLREYRAGGFEVVGLEGDQFDMRRIKLGLPGRDEDIDRYRAMLVNMGRAGVPLLCLNFMVLGWQRSGTAVPGRGGALVTAFRAEEAEALGVTEAGEVSAGRMWENWTYFIRAVAPAAEAAGVRMALHPDDPPVPRLRGVARILTSTEAMARAVAEAASPAVGFTFCQGSIATMGEDVAAAARRFGSAGQIAFVHVRDVRGRADSFVETFPDEGDTDMAAVFRAYAELGLDCPIRPDHAPAMDGDPRHDGPVQGTNVGYEANGMIYTVGYMKGLAQASGITLR